MNYTTGKMNLRVNEVSKDDFSDQLPGHDDGLRGGVDYAPLTHQVPLSQ